MATLKKPTDERLFMLIKNWLGVYLPTERRASPYTIANYQQNALALLRKPDAQVGAGGRLADAALLVGDR